MTRSKYLITYSDTSLIRLYLSSIFSLLQKDGVKGSDTIDKLYTSEFFRGKWRSTFQKSYNITISQFLR